MALQLTIYPRRLAAVPEPNTFHFDTRRVPVGRVSETGGGPVVITRKRHRRKPRVWTDGKILARKTITGKYDVKRNGHNALLALKNMRDASVPVVVRQPRGDTPLDTRVWLVEKVEETERDWFESTGQDIGYTVVLLEVDA